MIGDDRGNIGFIIDDEDLLFIHGKIQVRGARGPFQ
jgi:hypothetical protein